MININNLTAKKSNLNFTTNQQINDTKETQLIDNNIENSINIICGERDFCIADSLELDKLQIRSKLFNIKTYNELKTVLKYIALNSCKFLQISSHADEQGIYINDNLYTIDELTELFRFTELEILFLANCKSINLLEKLKHTSKYIVATIDDIVNEDMIKFVNLFWFSYIQNKLSFEQIDKLTYYLMTDIYKNLLFVK